jgi:hypothetical protein
VTTDPAIEWAVEIRDYLLGRLSRNRRTGDLPKSRRVSLRPAPIRGWWMFEGKRYAPLPGRLRDHWELLARMLHSTLRTFNPTWRVSDRPDGWVDWGRTLARGLGQIERTFVVQSSRVGLDEAERDALLGWARWIADEWHAYCCAVDAAAVELPASWPASPQARSPLLSRWAHIARRSRWPVMRDVVAETLRVVLEAQDVERVPLPADRAVLFELLCLVRVLRCLGPAPEVLRWLGSEKDGNKIAVDGVTAVYQWTLERTRCASAYTSVEQDAIERFCVPLPERADLVLLFDPPGRAGVRGILIEAKSGAQSYAAALEQLRVYRAAMGARPSERFVVWGIVEKAPCLTPEQLQWIRACASDRSRDIWVFSSADDIGAVLAQIFDQRSTQPVAPAPPAIRARRTFSPAPESTR